MKNLNLNLTRAIIATAISLLIFFLLFLQIDADQVLRVIFSSDLQLILLTVFISLAVNIFWGALKWKRILFALGYPLSFKEVLSIRSGCLPLKIVFPLKTSELIKAYYLEKQRNLPFMRGLSSILLDKMLNLLVTLGIFLIGVSVVQINLPRFLPIIALLVTAVFLFSSPLRGILLKLSQKINLKFYQFTVQLFSSFQEISVKEKIILTCYSIVYQLSEFMNTYILFKAVGISVPFSLLLVFVPLVMIINNFPITVLGLGTREALMVFLFARYGPGSFLLSAGILVSLVEHILPVVFGLFFIKSFLDYFLPKGNTSS